MRRLIQTAHSLITAPAVPALDLAYVTTHLKAISNAEDTLIAGWIDAARQYFEEQTGRQLITATWEYWLDAFPLYGRIELPHPPLQSVTSVKYIASDGTLTDFTDGGSPATALWQSRTPAGPYANPGWIEPIVGQVWPTTRCESGAVRIQYVAGYGDNPEDVPDLVKACLCFLIGHFDQFRSEVVQGASGSVQRVPIGMDVLLRGFKYSALPTTILERSWPE